jgi:ATP-dependent DNA helicase RecQ
VHQVIEFAEQPGCLVRHLLSYFGEDRGRDCGHCGRCLGEAAVPTPLEKKSEPVIDEGKLCGLRREHPRALSSARQITRFLCGLSSPLLTQAKLTKDPLFGSLAEQAFADVLGAVSRVS